jgi:hypothetical protein
MVKTDLIQCKAVGEVLKQYHIKPSFLHREFLTVDISKEKKLSALFFAVAVCHQTHTLHNPKSGNKGWDYIEEVFLQMMKEDDPWLSPEFIRSQSQKALEYKLMVMFSETGKPEDTTLNHVSERAELMHALASFISNSFNGSYSFLLEKSGNRLLHDGSGYFELLEKSAAFADPRRKKSMFLYKLLDDAGLYSITDTENLIPIMDYHMQRVLLRSGCVLITDENLFAGLQQKTPQQSDEPVRSACIDAAREIAEASGHSITAMNDFFWPMGRSCCLENPVCVSEVCSKTPCTLSELSDYPEHTKCMLQNICKGATDAAIRELWEPSVETHFY